MMIWQYKEEFGWCIIIGTWTGSYLKNTGEDSLRIAAWQVCICGRWPEGQYRR